VEGFHTYGLSGTLREVPRPKLPPPSHILYSATEGQNESRDPGQEYLASASKPLYFQVRFKGPSMTYLKGLLSVRANNSFNSINKPDASYMKELMEQARKITDRTKQMTFSESTIRRLFK
jgi:hypothetical protein